MFGVMRLTFDEEVESISGDDDFFSVARTMPLVADGLDLVLRFPICRCRRTLDS